MASLSRFTLLSCLLLHIQTLASIWWISYAGFETTWLYWSICHGTLYLLYPICGWLTEAYFSSFRMLKWSFNILLISSAVAITFSVDQVLYPQQPNTIMTCATVILVMAFAVGLGMYEANAIQFGMDQMMEASSEQLSSFIHWYFWCAHVGPLLISSINICVYWYFSNSCTVQNESIDTIIYSILGWIMLFGISTQFIVYCFGIVLITCYEKHSHIQQTSRNPLKNIFSVLKYSYHHKYPERRSAFTYWENDIPSRIDLGKEKYGGPFTYEQVEDVKTMFRLLLVMASLFGFHIVGDGYSITTYTMNTTGCPSFVPFAIFTCNPEHISFFIVSIGVPLFHLMKKGRCTCIRLPSLLTRLQIGLFVCLLSEALHCVYSIILPNNDFKCDETYYFKKNITVLLKCIAANIKVVSNDSSCQHFCSSPPVDSYIINMSVIILVLQGISYLLIFMTMLEFICAQSPNSMKGLLIGIWYSMLAIRVFIINVLDTREIYDIVSWNIYHGVKGVCIFVSIVIFPVVCRNYRYRERNEIVNEQNIIEEQYERELLMNESEDADSSSEDDELIQDYMKDK